MSTYQIQFQKGLSLPDFFKQFGSREQCEAHLFSLKWPKGFICPKCGGHHACSFNKGKHTVYQCKICQKQTSLYVGTIFERTHLPLTIWYLGIYFISEAKTSIAALDLHRKLGVNHKTAWLMHHKLMHCMVEEEKKTKIGMRVEMDDAYLGGKLKGGKAGRGSENKQPFVAAVETSDDDYHAVKRIKLDPVSSFTIEQIKVWTSDHIKPGSRVVSDALACFAGVEESCSHEIHNASQMTEKGKELHFKWVNTVLANVKTSLTGTFHSIECHKYSDRYLGAIVYRFNRRWCLTEIFTSLCRTASKTPPQTLKQLQVIL